jgi:NTE family protein
MAIPGFFTPVLLDGLMLVDGGVLNNFPVDVVRQMGAEIVIGVDVHADLMPIDKLLSMSNTLPQLINLLCMNKYEENARQADLIIRPDLQEYSAADFNTRAIDSLLRRGERAARARWDELIQLKEKYALEKTDDAPRDNRLARGTTIFRVREITFRGITPRQEEWLRRRIPLHEHTDISRKDIHRIVNILHGTRAFASVNYRLTGGPEYDLEFILTPQPVNTINIGARFDSEDMGAILLNTTTGNRLIRGTGIALTARLGRYPYLRAEVSIGNPLSHRFNLAGEARFYDIDLYTRGEKTTSVTYRYYLSELSVSNLHARALNIQAGLRYEYFDYNDFLFADRHVTEKVRPEGFFSYFAKIQVETLDKASFPDRGLSLQAEFSHHTTNLFTYRNGVPFSALAVRLGGILPLTSRLKAIPVLHARTLLGHTPAYSYYNCMGGTVPGRLSARQLPFWGIPRVEMFDNSLFVGQLQVRQQIRRTHYVTLACNVAQHADDFAEMFFSKVIWGGGIAYSRPTRVGPLDMVFTLSNWTKRLHFYLNLGFFF